MTGKAHGAREREQDGLYMDDVLLLPRGDCAIWVGRDFPNPEKVHVRDCVILVGAFHIRPFLRRRRLRWLRDPVARLDRLIAVDKAMRWTL